MSDQTPEILRMGWYVDTSVVHDFIDRNIRVGLDSAEPADSHVLLRVNCRNDRAQSFVPLKVNGRNCTFELTESVDCLRNIHLTYGTKFYHSELTKAEVYRSLRRAHPSRTEAEICSWWDVFAYALLDCRRVERAETIDAELSHLALSFPIKKNVQDYIHLLIAKQNKLAFVTSDKLDGQIPDLAARFYEHIYYWPTLKLMVPVDAIFSE